MDLALNNQQWLMYHKTQPKYSYLLSLLTIDLDCYLSANTGVSMYTSPSENGIHEFVLATQDLLFVCSIVGMMGS